MNKGFIKNKILDNIQNNLNVKNIKYLLYFIANPIILSLYGLSFKSITDKYLNFYCHYNTISVIPQNYITKIIRRCAVILLISAHLSLLYSLFFYTFRFLFYIISEPS